MSDSALSHPLSHPLSHRLAAILVADAAGCSRLTAGDDRATVAALDTARAVFRTHIEAQQGRVIDMAGDSVLAVFGTAAGAVTAALAIQAQINPLADAEPEERCMRFRIGVQLGDVIEKGDGTVCGDGVNIAARLDGLAEPGGISVSESIRSAVKGKVDAAFEDQGEQQPARPHALDDALHGACLRAGLPASHGIRPARRSRGTPASGAPPRTGHGLGRPG